MGIKKFRLIPDDGLWLHLKPRSSIRRNTLKFNMITLLLTLCFGSILCYLFYKWATKNNQFFELQHLKSMKPTFLIGNSADMMLRKKAVAEFILDLYNKFPKDRIFGFFDMRRPTYYLRDPEIVKQLAVKNFDYFIDHRVVIDENLDPLFGKSLVSLSGNAWKEMRGTLSPAFTGSKMRLMFDLVVNCGEDMTNYLSVDLQNNESKQIVEMKELFSRFSNDVIATCAFGIEINSLKNPKNEFYTIGEHVTNFSTISSIFKFLGFTICPWLMKKLQITFLSKADTTFFRSIITDTIQAREKQNIIRQDMINLLMNAKKGQLQKEQMKSVKQEEVEGFATVEEHDIGKCSVSELSEDDIIAQCFLFFFAGFDTVSTAMSFMAYELALNPEIQQKLLVEVDNTKNDLQGKKLTYDVLQKMKYLDMITCETLRKWPPAPITDRICVKDFNFKDGDINIQFKKGDNYWIPIYAFHYDPKYYPDPTKFDPERFNEENKDNINPLTYLPFGVGPRNCIGSRFALMETKAIIYYILLNFTFEVCDKTSIPLKMGIKKFRLIPDDGLWLQLKPRNTNY